MLTNVQLRNFDRFRRAVETESRGRWVNPPGAYDSALGAAKHGVDLRDFRRGGAFDAEEGGASVEIAERLLEFLRDKLQPQDFTTAETMLYDRVNAKDANPLADRISAWAKTMRLSDADCAALMKIVAPAADDKPTAGKAFGQDSRMRRVPPSAEHMRDFEKAFPNAARVGVGGL